MDTSDKRIDEVIHYLKEQHPTFADLLHAVRSERNMLAYEKGGHQLWKRMTQDGD